MCLKEGDPILLIRNFHRAHGYCNRIWYIIKCINSTVIYAVITSGAYKKRNIVYPKNTHFTKFLCTAIRNATVSIFCQTNIWSYNAQSSRLNAFKQLVSRKTMISPVVSSYVAVSIARNLSRLSITTKKNFRK